MKAFLGIIGIIYAAIVIWLCHFDMTGGLAIGLGIAVFVLPWMWICKCVWKRNEKSRKFNQKK